MHHRHPPRAFLFGLALAVTATLLPAGAQPAHDVFASPPPGTIVESQTVYLTGEAMHARWRAVVSKVLLGKGNGGDSFYQWYLSIYALDATTYRLKYRSPGNGGPLAKVVQATEGVKLWFPVASLHLAGSAELMQPGVQQLVVQSHEMSADCGAATVTVFTVNSAGNVVPAVTVRNGCDLNATIAHAPGTLDSLHLAGPYYGPNAAMCCPTKPKATASLAYRNGSWVEAPKYYELYVGKFAPE